jgi:hypothetical protein
MNESITFTTTAMVRPSLIEQTYESFAKKTKLNLKDFLLRLNVDPAPHSTEKSMMKVVNVASRFFGKVDYRLSDSCSFPKAVKWCWSDVKTPYVFHLEDDWRLIEFIDINDMIDILNKNPLINQVCLRAYYNQTNLGLLPHIIRGNAATNFSKYMKDDINPEIQMKSGQCRDDSGNLFCAPESVMHHPANPNSTVIKDLGRIWMKYHNKRMIRPNNFFTAWEQRK